MSIRLPYATIDEALSVIDQFASVTDRATAFGALATATGQIELRVINGFGFGGKLWWEPNRRNSQWRMSFYTEDSNESRERLQAQINDELAKIAPVSTAQVEVIVDRDGVSHLPAGDGDDEFQPVACGQGITMNGGRSKGHVDCRACRIGQSVGAELAAALFDLADVLEDTMRFKTFPIAREQFAQHQLDEIRLLRVTGDIREVVNVELRRGVPAGSYPNVWRMSYVELFERWAERFVRICEAHRSSRFPNRKPFDAAIGRVTDLLAVSP